METRPCGHVTGKDIWESIERGWPCVFCQADAAEDRVRLLEYKLVDCFANNLDRMFIYLIGSPEFVAAQTKLLKDIPEDKRKEALDACFDILRLAIDHGVRIGKNEVQKARS